MSEVVQLYKFTEASFSTDAFIVAIDTTWNTYSITIYIKM